MREPSATSPLSVVIAGCGAITAVGCGVDALLAALQKNSSGLRANEKFNSPRFQSNIVGAAARNFDDENPAWFLATEALKQARESSQNILEKIPAERIGLILATTKANVEALERISENRPCSDSARRHLQGNFLADDLAVEHGARGPVQCLSTACVSGLIAIQQGTKIIQRGEADAVFVVGVDYLSEFVVAGFTALKAIDPHGCRPFDKDRCGLSPGEAGAAMVLVGQASSLSSSKSQLDRQDACPTIIIRSWGGSNDANHLTGPSRDGSGLAQAIRVALDSAKLSPQEIDYVNAHGTGTPYNDAMESLALKTIFGDTCPPFSGLKGMFGHTLGAAGVVETIACGLAMQKNFLPGTPQLNLPADGVPKSILREPRFGVRVKNVLKLNTGFGGTNGALILSS